MPIRAVAVDIDGTVTDYERRLQWPGVEALRRVEAQGIPVLSASGNVAPVTRAFANFVGLSGPLICENGGVVYDAAGRRRRLLATRKRPDRAARHLARKGFRVRPLWSDDWRVSELALELDLDEDRVRKALDGWGLEVVTTRFALHLMEPGIDKFQGLKVALRYLRGRPRVRLDEVLAIGDSNNDVSMLEGCGRSGVVANATPRAKAAAGYVARKRFGAGVREILHHYGVA